MRMKTLWQTLLFASLTLVGLSAHAGLILTLQDLSGGGSVSVIDGNGDGVVTYNGSLGSWTVNVSTGISNPAIGTQNLQAMDLNSVNVSGGSGTLQVSLTRTGLTASPAHWVNAVGGTTNGSVSFRTLLDGGLISSYSAGAGAFSNTDSGGINAVGPYALTLVGVITHTGAGMVSSFDYNITVPEPAMISLLGAGLMFVGWAGRRRRRV